VRLYHRTTREAAAAILAEGFRDGDSQIEGPDGKLTGGVELSSVPFDAASLGKAKGEGALLVPVYPGQGTRRWEWKMEDPPAGLPTDVEPVREFIVPSAIVNRYGPPEIVS
jgi:hypothetical protein